MEATTTTERSGNLAKTFAYYATFVALGLSAASLGPTLPGLAEHTRTQIGQVSFLFVARALGYLLGSLRGGRWFDRMPGHRLMAWMLVGMAAVLFLVPAIPLLWLLIAAMLVLGFSEATVDVGGNTLLVWVHGARVGPYMNGLHLFFGLGALLSPVIIAQGVLWSGDLTLGYRILAVLMLPVAVWVARLPSPPILGGVSKDKVAAVNPWLLALFVSFFFLHVGAEGSFGGWIFTYARALDLADETVAAYLTSSFWAGLTLGRLLAIPIATRVRSRWILLADLLGCLAGLILILLRPGSFSAALTGTMVMGLSIASIFPTTMTFAGRRMQLDGRITGWFLVGSSAGSMFLPWLIGQLFESIGPHTIILAILVDVILAIGVFGLLMVYTRPKSVPVG